MIRKILVVLALLALLVIGTSLAYAGDPSQWETARAGDPSQWGVQGDPSQWGLARLGDPSQWGIQGDPSQWS